MREVRVDCEVYLGENAYLRRLCAAQEIALERLARSLMAELAACAGELFACYALCSNTALVFLCAYRDGRAVFSSAPQVLENLSIPEIAEVAALYYESFGGERDVDA